MSTHPTNLNLNIANYEPLSNPLNQPTSLPSPKKLHSLEQRVIEYESKITKLKVYLKQAEEFKKQDVCNIFNWRQASVAVAGNDNLVKKLGHKVKSTIKAINLEKSKLSRQEVEYQSKKKRHFQDLISAALHLQKNNKKSHYSHPINTDRTQEQRSNNGPFGLHETPAESHFRSEKFGGESNNASPVKRGTPGTIKRQEELLLSHKYGKDVDPSRGVDKCRQSAQVIANYNSPERKQKNKSSLNVQMTNDLTLQKSGKSKGTEQQDKNNENEEQMQKDKDKAKDREHDKDEFNVAKLKRHLLTYVNIAIQGNDDSLASMQKYLNALEKRIIAVQKVEKHLQHFMFEKAVKMQESVRKSKNFCYGGPRIPGDSAYHLQSLEMAVSVELQQLHQQKTRLAALSAQNYQLKQTIQKMKINSSQQQKAFQLMRKQLQQSGKTPVAMNEINQNSNNINNINARSSMNKQAQQSKSKGQLQDELKKIYSKIQEYVNIHYKKIHAAYFYQLEKNKDLKAECFILKSQLAFLSKDSEILSSNREIERKYRQIEQELKQLERKVQNRGGRAEFGVGKEEILEQSYCKEFHQGLLEIQRSVRKIVEKKQVNSHRQVEQ